MRPRTCFFVGIGGSGMMPLAMIVRARGAEVAGSDRALDAGRLAPKFAALRDLGIALVPQDGSGITSPDQLVVASAAIEDTVPDIQAATRIGARRMSRADLNADLFNAAALPIGVAGTSGKSTVTGMIGWILHAAGRDPTVMNGAVMTNFATPDAPFASALVGAGDSYVSEVDESDGTIALYAPRIAVLNNVSLDHKSLEELRDLFGAFLARAGTAIVNADDPEAAELAMALPRERLVTFSLGGEADLVATDIIERPDGVTFTLSLSPREREGAPQARKGEGRTADSATPVTLAVPGRHNVANALAALAAATAAGVPLAEAARHLAGFTGLKRRLEPVGTARGITVIDDFAHNPDKIAATLTTLHTFPGRLLILFQPHGYGPLRMMRSELAATFARHLAFGDRLILPDPVYQGGTVDRAVTSGDLAADIAAAGRNARHIPDRIAAAAHLAALARPGDRILVMGARDDTLSVLAGDVLGMVAENAFNV